jgi:GNAT superfamily N-acetyltransferase
MKLDEIEIIEGNLSDLKNIYEIFKTDFAAEEIKNYEQLEFLMVKQNYKLLLAKDSNLNEFIGYAFIYELNHLDAIWLDYMAIYKPYRNSGYGTLLFNKIAQLKKGGMGIFIEVEIPEVNTGHTRENQLNRIRFYERLGAKRLNIPYELPTNDGGLPMYLYFKPSPSVQLLPKETISEAIIEVFEKVHWDIENKDNILKRLLSFIEDFNI